MPQAWRLAAANNSSLFLCVVRQLLCCQKPGRPTMILDAVVTPMVHIDVIRGLLLRIHTIVQSKTRRPHILVNLWKFLAR